MPSWGGVKRKPFQPTNEGVADCGRKTCTFTVRKRKTSDSNVNKRKKETMSIGEEAAAQIQKQCPELQLTKPGKRKFASIIDRIVKDRSAKAGNTDATDSVENAETGLAPCPWCGAVATEEDEWGSLITHKQGCYWTTIHGDSIGKVRVNNSQKNAWNKRAASNLHAQQTPTVAREKEKESMSEVRDADGRIIEDETPDSVGNCESTETGVVIEVLEERARQDRKWGEQNHDPFGYLAILVEEVGELAQAALHLRFGGPEAFGVRSELLQVAAVAIAFIECLDRAKWHADSPEWPPVSTPSQTATATPSRGAQKRWTAETVMAIAKSGAAFEACERISQAHNATLPVPEA